MAAYFTDGVYSILYEEVDESDVDVVRFPQTCPLSNGSVGAGVEEFRFPKAGSPNSKSSLKLIQFRIGGSRKEICDVRLYELKHTLESYFPWMEYLVRAGWTPDGE